MSRPSWGTIAGDFSGSGASLSPEPQPDDKNHVLYQYLGACAILLVGVVFMLNYVRGGRQRKPRADPRAENALLDPGPFECAKQQPERSAAPLPAGLQLAAAAPRVVSQTYLVIEVTAFHGLLNRHSQAEITLNGAENSIQWTVQRRIGAFTSLAFAEGLSGGRCGCAAGSMAHRREARPPHGRSAATVRRRLVPCSRRCWCSSLGFGGTTRLCRLRRA